MPVMHNPMCSNTLQKHITIESNINTASNVFSHLYLRTHQLDACEIFALFIIDICKPHSYTPPPPPKVWSVD